MSGQKTAPTAEALMRSRYSAFHQGNLDYLIATHHPDYRQSNERDSLARSLRSTQWLYLQILSTRRGQRKDKQGTVEFVAAYRDGPAAGAAFAQQLHERSEFVKENGQWFYTTGASRSPFTPNRNQPCWCGSGKRFRQCHEKIEPQNKVEP